MRSEHRLASELRRERAGAQLLTAGAADPRDAVGRLLAVQAQDWRSARLALRARVPGLTASAVDAALADRSLVVAWLQRGTLHLVRAEDHGWLLGLTARAGIVQSRRRLAEEGLTDRQVARSSELIVAALADGTPRSRDELADQLTSAGVPAEGQAVPHAIRLVALRGLAVLGPADPTGRLLVRMPDRPSEPGDRDMAVVDLARRYLAGHGPATAADLAAWSGVALRDARAGLNGLGVAVQQRADGLIELADRAPDAKGAVPPRLLPSFDPNLLGWADRSFAVPAALRSAVHPGGGILRATATVDGVAVGTWSLRSGRAGAEVVLDIAEAAHVDALQDEVADVTRFGR